MNIVVKIAPNAAGHPSGKLADAELHFAGGELEGLKLIGFSVWKRRDGKSRSVPSRRANTRRPANVEHSRCFDQSAPTRVRDLVLRAYEQHAAAASTSSNPRALSLPDGRP